MPRGGGSRRSAAARACAPDGPLRAAQRAAASCAWLGVFGPLPSLVDGRPGGRGWPGGGARKLPFLTRFWLEPARVKFWDEAVRGIFGGSRKLSFLSKPWWTSRQLSFLTRCCCEPVLTREDDEFVRGGGPRGGRGPLGGGPLNEFVRDSVPSVATDKGAEGLAMAGAGPFGGAGLCAILARIDAALALSTACEEGFDSSSRRPSDEEASRRPCDALLALSMAACDGWALCFVGTTNPTPESSESDSEESESLDSDSTGAARFFVGGGFFGGAGFLDLLWLLEGTTNALAVVSSSAGKSSPRSSERRRAPI
jgi:hypothetical protein